MSGKFLIGFDMDGVLIDHTQNKIGTAKTFGHFLEPHQTPADIMKHLMAEEGYREIQRIIYDDPIIGLTPGLTEGALEVLRELKAADVPFALISRRKFAAVGQEYLRVSPLREFFNDSNTFFVKTKGEKNDKAVELGIKLYIDDQPSVLEKMPAVDHRVLFDPFRVFETWEKASGCFRISAWQKFLPLVKSLNL